MNSEARCSTKDVGHLLRGVNLHRYLFSAQKKKKMKMEAVNHSGSLVNCCTVEQRLDERRSRNKYERRL